MVKINIDYLKSAQLSINASEEAGQHDDAQTLAAQAEAHATIDAAQTLRAILAELQAQRPAEPAAGDWDRAVVAAGEGD